MRLRKRHIVSDQEVGETLKVSAASGVWFPHCRIRRQHAGLLRAVGCCVQETGKQSFVAAGQRIFILAVKRDCPGSKPCLQRNLLYKRSYRMGQS